MAGLEAYLDIETTGLFREYGDITVIGIHIDDGGAGRFVQLVGDEISAESVLDALAGVTSLYTYNGSRFDLPFIHFHLGLDLANLFPHCDLMYNCWQSNLYGGLKSVERQLGIRRHLTDVSGWDAIRLWWRYVNDADRGALRTLLEYNREDVQNLKTLRTRLP